jgi:hypothetical protein
MDSRIDGSKTPSHLFNAHEIIQTNAAGSTYSWNEDTTYRRDKLADATAHLFIAKLNDYHKKNGDRSAEQAQDFAIEVALSQKELITILDETQATLNVRDTEDKRLLEKQKYFTVWFNRLNDAIEGKDTGPTYSNLTLPINIQETIYTEFILPYTPKNN